MVVDVKNGEVNFVIDILNFKIAEQKIIKHVGKLINLVRPVGENIKI